MTPVVWILGRADRPEFAPVLHCIRGAAGAASPIFGPDIAAVLANRAAGIPDLVVALQSHPDEYSSAEIARLLAHAPIARWIVVAGAWCEADGRRRDLWPTAARVPAVWAVERLQTEWSLLIAGQGTPLPLTATRDECFAADHPPSDIPLNGLRVYVASPDRSWRETQAILIQQAGATPVEDPDQATVLWLDGDPWETGGRHQVEAFHAEQPDTPIVVSLDFPLPELVEDVRTAGATAVLPKLAPVGLQLRELQRLTSARV